MFLIECYFNRQLYFFDFFLSATRNQNKYVFRMQFSNRVFFVLAYVKFVNLDPSAHPCDAASPFVFNSPSKNNGTSVKYVFFR